MYIWCDPPLRAAGGRGLKTRSPGVSGYKLKLFPLSANRKPKIRHGPASSMNGKPLGRLHWAKDGIHFTYSQEDPRSSTPTRGSRWMPTPARCATWWDEHTQDSHLDDAHGRAGNRWVSAVLFISRTVAKLFMRPARGWRHLYLVISLSNTQG